SLLRDICFALNKRLLIITDTHLFSSLGKTLQFILQDQGLSPELLAFPAGEKYKTRETKQQLEDQLLEKNYGRDTCLIALGGGVVSDLVGFLGATYCRGIPVIYIPTTLLSMVDASIGGKTGINTLHGKNLIGTFTQPHAVLIDTNTLATLPAHEWRNGIVEIIKHALIADANLFSILQKNFTYIKQSDILLDIIYTSCLIKKNIVEQDEKELSLRKLLNFGHTIGHTIETIENYHISHGEAVAIGILVESYLSIKQGLLSENILFVIEKLLRKYGLPLKTSAFRNKDQFYKILLHDKKTINNQPHFVLLQDIGKPHCQHGHYSLPIDSAHLNQALDWATNVF
ncbi:MAG: 3-dehydroquinate synthase, partial [Gammaproteobacteria bacterium]|nr:3-dehydroquinate synthase [Gammaproteobacteria bacterium]